MSSLLKTACCFEYRSYKMLQASSSSPELRRHPWASRAAREDTVHGYTAIRKAISAAVLPGCSLTIEERHDSTHGGGGGCCLTKVGHSKPWCGCELSNRLEISQPFSPRNLRLGHCLRPLSHRGVDTEQPCGFYLA